MSKITTVDIAIFGGGIAGLWALNRLRAAGFKAVLFEANTLGGGQTIKSQGIIHGGIKYALTGILTGASQAIESMPKRWKDCLAGEGEIDLRKAKILSQEQLLWSTGSLTSDLAGFFASKALNSRVQKLKRDAYPRLLQHAQFKGNVYRLEEVVLDSPSLIAALAVPQQEFIYKIDPQNLHFNFDINTPGKISSLTIKAPNEEIQLIANRYLFTSGEGNQAVTQGFVNAAPQQCRPLQMVVVKLDEDYPLFAHCLDNGMNPRVTITSHRSQDGKYIWYIGGQLAEDGVKRSKEEQITASKKELSTLFPWLDLSNAEWGSFYINRAEPKQPDGKRPDAPFLQSNQNVMTGWPTKLALTPLFVDNILSELEQQKITPDNTADDLTNLSALAKPAIAKPVWDEIFESLETV
jgi:hypothetical protein